MHSKYDCNSICPLSVCFRLHATASFRFQINVEFPPAYNKLWTLTRKTSCWPRTCGWTWSGATLGWCGAQQTTTTSRTSAWRRTGCGGQTSFSTTAPTRTSTRPTRLTWPWKLMGASVRRRPACSNQHVRSDQNGRAYTVLVRNNKLAFALVSCWCEKVLKSWKEVNQLTPMTNLTTLSKSGL